MRSRRLLANSLPTFLTAALFILPTAALAFSDGPPDGRANDPPDNQNCTGCHSSFPLNSGTGALTLTGLPAEYDPGVTYTLTVMLEDPDASRWGFEMTVIRDSDLLAAGDLDDVDGAVTQISEGGGDERDYAKHRSAGTYPGQTGSGSWQIDWTAPDAGSGIAHFYLVGNGANNAGGNTGDRIYAIDASLIELGTSSVHGPLAEGAPTMELFPNPAPGRGTIAFALSQDETIDLKVVDAQGRFVRQLASGARSAGSHQVAWDGRDHRGLDAPAGVYFTLLATTRTSRSERLVLVR